MTRLERWGIWLDRHEKRALGSLIIFYLLITGAQTERKLVWADELITYYIAEQPGLTGIWHALRAGADPNPPLMHVLVKASTALLGGNALGMRLPALLSVLLALLAMWWMLRRWVQPVFALAGVLAFMATRGFDYAYDARSYAPMMSFAMASLALWMCSRDVAGWRRLAALTGMAIALAAGISTNYYCVLAFFPIAAGELASRRFRAGVWLAMAIASLPLFAYLPLIRHNIAEFAPHAWNRPQVSMIGMSYLELVEGIFWPVLGLGVYYCWRRRKGGRDTIITQGMSRSEVVAIGVLVVYPFLGFAIAVGGAGMISPRCVVPVCCGIGLAAGVVAERAFATPRAGMILVLGMVAWVGVRESVCAAVLLEQRRAFLAIVREAEAAPHPLLVADSSVVLPLYFYANSETRSSIAFPVEFGAIHRYERDDSGEQNLWAGRNSVFPFAIEPFSDLQPTSSSAFSVIARPDGWLAKSLEVRNVRLKPIGDDLLWSDLGGVFTPMGHPETRLLTGSWPHP